MAHSRRFVRQTANLILGLGAAGGLGLSDAAVAAPKVLQPPAGAPAAQTARVIDRAPKEADMIGGNIVDGTHMAVSGASGSLAVGLMFGPLGVAANVAKVKEKNLERARPLEALGKTDTVALLKAARAPAGEATGAGDGRAFELLPAIQVRFDTDTAFHLGCTVSASLMKGEKRTWRARYSVELPGLFDSQSAASIEAATQAVAPCLSEASRLFDAHIGGGMQPGPLQPVVLNGKTVKMAVVESEYPARIIGPDMAGVAEYPVQ